MKKFNCILITLLSSALAFGNTELKKIDVIQTIAHPALDSTYKGTIDQLAIEGFIDSKTIKIKFANAQGDSVLSNQIARKFASEKADVIIAIPTPAAQSAATATKNTNIPVVFSSVTDPIDAGLTANNLNITGVSNFIDIAPQLELFKEILPNLKKLGFIYNPGEVY